MNRESGRFWDHLWWLRYWVALFPLVALSISARADCPDSTTLRRHVIYLEACRSKCNTDNEAEESATGVLITDNGLILSVYELVSQLAEPTDKAKEKVDLADESQYQVVVSTDKTRASGERSGVGKERHEASVVGFDKQRGLLLLKISVDSVKKLKLIASRIGQEELQQGDRLCSIGFSQAQDEAESPGGTGKVGALSAHRRYQFKADFQSEEPQRGSPVWVDSPASLLVGIVSGHETTTGRWSEVIPIDYADGLIARVFIRDLKMQLEEVSKQLTKTEVQFAQVKNQMDAILSKSPSEQYLSYGTGCMWESQGKTSNCPLAVVCKSSLGTTDVTDFKSAQFIVNVDYTDRDGIAGKKSDTWSEQVSALPSPVPPNTFCLKAALDVFEENKAKFHWRSIDTISAKAQETPNAPGKDVLINVKYSPFAP